MERLAKVKSVAPMRTFETSDYNGNKREVKVVEIEMQSGFDNFVVSAFDKTAEQIDTLGLKEGAYYFISLSLRAQTVEKDGKKTFFNRLVLEKIEEI